MPTRFVIAFNEHSTKLGWMAQKIILSIERQHVMFIPTQDPSVPGSARG
jgi:hypothetical protein